MARRWQSGFELNSITDGVEFDTNSATVQIVTTNPRSGTYHGRVSGSSNGFWRVAAFSSNQSTIGYTGVAVCIHSAVNASTQLVRFSNTSNANVSNVTLTSSNTLVLLKANGVQIGSPSAALSLDTWYYIELKHDGSATATLEARLDGSVFATGTNSATSPWARSLVGVITGTQTTADIYFDDWKINDSSGTSQNSYPGLGFIVYVRPAGTGDSNGFLVANGGTAGAVNNYTRVQEVTPDDGTTYNASGVLNASDLFTVGSSGIPSGSTINVVAVSARAANLVAADNNASYEVQVEATSGGTLAKSSVFITPDSTTYVTNSLNVAPSSLVLYNDPTGSAWTTTTIGTMQIGYFRDNVNLQSIAVTSIWASIDYTLPVAAPSSAYVALRIPNRNVGPMAMRRTFRQPYIPQYNSPAVTTPLSFTANILFTGNINLQTKKNLSAGLSFTGALKRVASKTLTASLSFTTSLVKRITHTFTGALSFTGALRIAHRFIQNFSASLNFTGNLVKGSVFFRSFTASLNFTGAITKRISHKLSGVLSFTGAFTKGFHINQIFIASLGFTGGLKKRTAKSLASNLSFSGFLTKVRQGLPSIFVPLVTTISSFTNQKTDAGGINTTTNLGGTNIASPSGSDNIEEISGQTKTDTLQGSTNETET